MRQPPGQILDDREVVIHRGRSGRHGYRPALLLAALVAAVVGAALMGRVGASAPGGDVAAATPRPSVRSVPSAIPSPATAPSPTPDRPAPFMVGGLLVQSVDRADVDTVAIPPDGRPVAFADRSIVYVAGQSIVWADMKGIDPPETIALLEPCQEVADVVGLPGEILFLSVGAPDGPLDTTGSGCPEKDRVNWEIVSVDPESHTSRSIARGSVTDNAALPVLATDGSGYATVAPARANDPAGPSVVEAHATSDTSNSYSVALPRRPAALALNDQGLLAIVPDAASGVDANVRSTRYQLLWTNGAAKRSLGYTRDPWAYAVAFDRVVWLADEPASPAVSGCGPIDFAQPTNEDGRPSVAAAAPTEPAGGCLVAAGDAYGSAAVAWAPIYSHADPASSYGPYVAFAGPDGSMAAISLEGDPVWLRVQGSSLVWVEQLGDGSLVARRVDLLRAHFR